MPTISQFANVCPLPVGFDTYRGCRHLCMYCPYDATNQALIEPELDEGPDEVRAFVTGQRTPELAACGQVPLRFGRASDPFQPCEEQHQRSLGVLQVLADTQYPCVFTTKGSLVATAGYLAILARCNIVGQVSMVSPLMDSMEGSAPTYAQRLEMVRALVPACKRVIARAQPLILEEDHLAAFEATLPGLAATGVYGVLVEAMVWPDKPHYTIPDVIAAHIRVGASIRAAGLKFLSGDACLHHLTTVVPTDSPVCCGCAGLPGFNPFKKP